MRGFRGMLLGLMVSVGAVAGAKAQTVEIEYWQYVFDARVKAMNELIKRFEAANPNIKVKQTTFPYADYQTKIAAAMPAGQGPDVVQLFYGWLDNFVGAKFIQPLPRDAFPPAAIEKDFYPIVSAMKRNGEYYALPTAVRSLALFYNKKLFQEAGLDPNTPPKTVDELLDMAKKTTKRDGAGNMLSAGITLDFPGQDYHWWRETLLRQNGGAPYSDDNKTVTYNSEAGAKALNWYADLQRTHKVGQVGFMDEGQAAFRAGRAAMTIDGSFRLAPSAASRPSNGASPSSRPLPMARRRISPATGSTPSPPSRPAKSWKPPRSSSPSSLRPRRCSSGSRPSVNCRPARPRPRPKRT